MIKLVLTLLGFFFIAQAFGQHDLSQTDTTLHYKELFYFNDSLYVTPYYSYYDSIRITTRVYPKERFDSNNLVIDTAQVVLRKEGTWRIDYLKKGKSYYYLAYYERDQLIGKRYDFDAKGRLLSTFTCYPRIKDTLFNGSQIIYYDKKGRIKSIEYIKFQEDQTENYYWHFLEYNKAGTLKSYSFMDEATGKSRFIQYFNTGLIRCDHQYDFNRTYHGNWNRKHNKLREEIIENGRRKRIFYINNQKIKETSQKRVG